MKKTILPVLAATSLLFSYAYGNSGNCDEYFSSFSNLSRVSAGNLHELANYNKISPAFLPYLQRASLNFPIEGTIKLRKNDSETRKQLESLGISLSPINRVLPYFEFKTSIRNMLLASTLDGVVSIQPIEHLRP